MKIERVRSKHQYGITELKGKKVLWQTYVLKPNGKRRRITASSEEKLYDKLYQFYFVDQKTTLSSLYLDWIGKCKRNNLSDRSMMRYDELWNRHYLGRKIVTTEITRVNEDMVENFIHQNIRDFDLTVKGVKNLLIVINGCYKIATRKKLISRNPMKCIEIKYTTCKPTSKKLAQKSVYLLEEKEQMFNSIKKDLCDNPRVTDSYAILLLFKLGLRLGEVVALRLRDINFDNEEIHIQSMETIILGDDNRRKTIVVEHTKMKSEYGDRILPLSDYELSIIRKVIEINTQYGFQESDYLFVDENGRTKSRAIDYRIRKHCKMIGIPIKSAHDIRRTVASELYNKGVSVEMIKDYMGHSDIKTTWGYIFNPNEKEKNASIYKDALKDLNAFDIH